MCIVDWDEFIKCLTVLTDNNKISWQSIDDKQTVYQARIFGGIFTVEMHKAVIIVEIRDDISLLQKSNIGEIPRTEIVNIFLSSICNDAYNNRDDRLEEIVNRIKTGAQCK